MLGDGHGEAAGGGDGELDAAGEGVFADDDFAKLGILYDHFSGSWRIIWQGEF